MKFEIKYGIPFSSAVFGNLGRELYLENVVIDTGSGGTIFSTQYALELGL